MRRTNVRVAVDMMAKVGLRPEHYDLWKDIEIKFNNELLGG